MQAVLAEINQYEASGELKTFSLRYVKADGKTGFKPRLRKSGGVYKESAAGERSNFGFRVKEHGVLLLQNVDSNQVQAYKIMRLTHFNGMRIQH